MLHAAPFPFVLGWVGGWDGITLDAVRICIFFCSAFAGKSNTHHPLNPFLLSTIRVSSWRCVGCTYSALGFSLSQATHSHSLKMFMPQPPHHVVTPQPTAEINLHQQTRCVSDQGIDWATWNTKCPNDDCNKWRRTYIISGVPTQTTIPCQSESAATAKAFHLERQSA